MNINRWSLQPNLMLERQPINVLLSLVSLKSNTANLLPNYLQLKSYQTKLFKYIQENLF